MNRKVWVIAQREYVAIVHTKAFVVSLLIVPAMMILAAFLAAPGEFSGRQVEHTIVLVNRSEASLALLRQRSAEQGWTLLEVPNKRFDETRRRELSAQLLRGELLAIAEIGARALSSTGPDADVLLYATATAEPAVRRLRSALEQALRVERLKLAGIPEPDAQRLMAPVPILLRGVGVDAGDAPEQDSGQAAVSRMLVLPAVLMLLFLPVLATAPQMLHAVIEEKQQRISEVLLGSVSPTHLMFGKLLGTVAAGLTSGAAYFLMGMGVAGAAAAQLSELLSGISLPPLFGLVAAVALVLALIIHASVFLTIGAAAQDTKDLQGLTVLAMLTLTLPLLAASPVLQTPDAGLSVTLSLFPLTAPLAMPLRLGAGALVPGWQLALSGMLALGAAMGGLWVAGRVFRVALLSQGHTPSLRQLAQWVFRG